MNFQMGRSGTGLTQLITGEIAATNHSVSNLTTAGAGTVLAASIAAGILRRTGPVGGFTDTFPSADAIRLALNSPPRGSSFLFFYNNTVAQAMTFAAGTGVITLGTVDVAASVCRVFNVTLVNDTPQSTHQVTTVNGSPVVTFNTPANSQQLSIGQAVSGTGIPAASYVKSVNYATGAVTIGTAAGVDANATADGTNIVLTFSPVVQFHGLGNLATP